MIGQKINHKSRGREQPLSSKQQVLSKQSQPVFDTTKVPLKSACACGGGCPKCQVQAKLKIGAVDSIYEREADQMAEQVIRMQEPNANSLENISDVNNLIQRKCSSCEKEELIQSKPTKKFNSELNPALSSQISSLSGGGRAMSGLERGFFEPRFGHDFSNVRIHNNLQANQFAHSVNARAFTLGNNIVFGAGEFSSKSVSGKRLFAHELTHTIQQDGNIIRRQSLPNPTATSPPTAPFQRPPASAFNPLGSALRTEREEHGLSRDSGPVVDEVESALFPTGGSGGVPCIAQPANFERSVATAINSELRTQIPLSPTDAPDPMPLAEKTADVSMPIINSYYAPHAPNVPPATFMASVSRKDTNVGDNIRTSDAWFAEFLGWFAGENDPVFNMLTGKCGITEDWWSVTFVPWLLATGTSFLTGSNQMRERAALFDTWNTSTTDNGLIEFGRGFVSGDIPGTVLHEAMHKFTHDDFEDQVGRLRNNGNVADRSITDNLTEGFTEYLARALVAPVITALQALTPTPLTPAEETTARAWQAYPRYFTKAVELRDILYSHGQDGEEAIRRAYFLGEGWRFGLLESASGDGSPIEMERDIPARISIGFSTTVATLPATAVARLLPIVNYLKSRNISTVTIIGSTRDYWPDFDTTWLGTSDEDVLSVQRAQAVRTHLVSAGIDISRITVSSLPTSSSTTEDTAVQINDDSNLTP